MLKLLCKRQGLLLASLILTLCACRDVPNPTGTDGNGGGGGGGGGGIGTGTAVSDGTFLGNWSGVFVDSSAGSSSLNGGTAVKARFFGQTQTTGTFRFDLTQVVNGFAAGTYQTFQSKGVLLTIDQSTMSRFPKGGVKMLNFDVEGQSLSLDDGANSMHMYMSKADANGNPIGSTANSGSGTNNGGGLGDGSTRSTSNNADPTVGHWGCTDLAGNQWQVNIRTDNQFYAQVSDASREHGSVWLEGSTTVTRGPGNPDLTMVVRSSDVGKYKGMILEATLHTNELDLHRPATKETMTCNPT